MSLNQIGIIFNFLAGFLLAPDIFGDAKFIQWEHGLRNLLPKLGERLLISYLRVASRGGEKLPSDSELPFLIAIPLVCFYGLILIWEIPLRLFLEAQSVSTFFKNVLNDAYSQNLDFFVLFWTLLVIFLLPTIIVIFQRKPKIDTFNLVLILIIWAVGSIGYFNISLACMLLVTMTTYVILLALLFSWPFLFIGLPIMVLEFLIVGPMSRRGVRGVMSAVGITCFILGNSLQFLADWIKP